MKAGAYPRQKCKHCGDQIATNSLAHHEGICAKASAEVREDRRQARAYAANNAAKAGRWTTKAKRPYHKRNALALVNVNHGRKLNVTLSLPVSVLMQLLPTINLERIEVS